MTELANTLCCAGAPFDSASMADVMSGRLKKYKAYIFPNLHYVTDEKRSTLQRLRRQGAKLALVGAMGEPNDVVFDKAPTRAQLRTFLSDAGVHIYNDDADAAVYANASYVALHNANAGRRTIRLPRAARVTELFADFKALADRKKSILDRDLVALVESKMASRIRPEREWKLDTFVVNSGNHMSATAQVTLVRNGKARQEAALGSGPIYAAFRAVEKIIRHKFALEDYRIEAVTERRDALGEVFVKISDKRGVYRGRGVSTDIIKGSILALLNAVNRMMEAGS